MLSLNGVARMCLFLSDIILGLWNLGQGSIGHQLGVQNVKSLCGMVQRWAMQPQRVF